MIVIAFNIDKVKSLMKEKNITIKDLAKSIGSTEKTLKKYLDGGNQANMTLLKIIKLGRALDVDFRTLLVE